MLYVLVRGSISAPSLGQLLAVPDNYYSSSESSSSLFLLVHFWQHFSPPSGPLYPPYVPGDLCQGFRTEEFEYHNEGSGWRVSRGRNGDGDGGSRGGG